MHSLEMRNKTFVGLVKQRSLSPVSYPSVREMLPYGGCDASSVYSIEKQFV